MMGVRGYLTSYARLFEDRTDDAPMIEAIEIPLIQRDYAQGRPGPVVAEIRTNFLEVLLDAVAGGQTEALDFVYGKVESTTLQPLDGQQRLTTLFLLHWFLSSRAGKLDSTASWTRFSYATRFSARRFCKRLVESPLPDQLPADAATPSAWITDQHWYLHVWRDDPTIQSMLAMIDAIAAEIDRRHPDLDAAAAWARLVDEQNPAISFYLLPLEDMESEEDLYIKMNSRGKPLTPFETFKATFEKEIAHSTWVDELGRRRSVSFAHKIDGVWSDLFWRFRGGDNLVDDEFVRYLDFVTQVCELREDCVGSGRLGDRAREVFGAANPRADEHLDFLFAAFDCWRDADHVADVFATHFDSANPGSADYSAEKVTLFTGGGTNLFELCIRHFDSQAKRNPNFTLQQTLLLYGVVLHLIEGTEAFPDRLRVLRNLASAPGEEIRSDRMPGLIRDVELIIRTGDLTDVKRFSKNQLADEQRKRAYLAENAGAERGIRRLEDHDLLRGTLAAFDVAASDFVKRARTFEAAFTDRAAWPYLTTGLLATGDYQRSLPKMSDWQFGTASASNEGSWRYLLADGDYDDLTATRTVLAEFLDDLAEASIEVDAYCQSLVEDAVRGREEAARYDWRYYLLKYESLRAGRPGIYRGELGYSMLMLRETQGSRINRDPILFGIWDAIGAGERVKDPWFTADPATPRWLELNQSLTGLRSVPNGFAVRPPQVAELSDAFRGVCEGCDDVESTDGAVLLRIPQTDGVDQRDRIEVGSDFVRALLGAGL